MKKVMKIIIPIMLLLTFALAFTACGDGGAAAPTPPAADPAAPAQPPADPADETVPGEGIAAQDIRIALVAHSPESILDDGSFNEGAWAGIQRFLTTHGQPADNANFFLPHTGDDVTRIDFVEMAIEWGANFIVLPGFHFVAASADMQDLFPDTKFVLLDAIPAGGRIEPNLAAIEYAEEEAGFLAGYAIVMEGHRNLGFMGGIAVPAVVRFGHGFIQGAEHAAASLGLAPGEVTINYTYLGGFAPDPVHVTAAAAWFHGGTEVIFAAAGGAGFSVKSAAEGAGGLVIGVDVDQHATSDTVITSAMKALDVSVFDMLTDFMNGEFRGGVEHMFNASIYGVGLPMANSRFQNFTLAQYNAIFAELASGAIVVNPSLDLGDILVNISLVEVNEL